MATIDLTAENFVETVENNEMVFVDLWASWCGPCRNFAPVYSEASDKNTDIVFAKVDTEANQELAAQLQVQAIPTIMAFKSGKLIYREAGALPPAAFGELVDAVRALDMAELEEENSQES